MRDGEYLDMAPRTFDVLQLLVERHGEIVTKDEILGNVWNGSYVEEGNLPVHISKLRQRLGESKSERYIETVAGIGYRFVAPVLQVEANEWLGFWPSNEIATPNSESHKLYLRGQHFLGKRTTDDIRKAIDSFRKSYSADPLNSLAYVGAVESYMLLYQTGILLHSDVSMRIQPLTMILSQMNQQIDLVQAMHGTVSMHLDWKFEKAAEHFRIALRLNPSYLVARYRYSDLLIVTGRFSEALIEIHQTLRVDPISTLTYTRLGRLFWKMGRYETALLYLEEAIELEADDWEALLIMGAVLAAIGRYPESVAALEKSITAHKSPETMSILSYVHALSGKKGEASKIIRELELEYDGVLTQPVMIAKIHLGLGDFATTYRYLKMAFDIHDADLIGLLFDPTWKPLRNQRQFQDLLQRIGIPHVKSD